MFLVSVGLAGVVIGALGTVLTRAYMPEKFRKVQNSAKEFVDGLEDGMVSGEEDSLNRVKKSESKNKTKHEPALKAVETSAKVEQVKEDPKEQAEVKSEEVAKEQNEGAELVSEVAPVEEVAQSEAETANEEVAQEGAESSQNETEGSEENKSGNHGG